MSNSSNEKVFFRPVMDSSGREATTKCLFCCRLWIR